MNEEVDMNIKKWPLSNLDVYVKGLHFPTCHDVDVTVKMVHPAMATPMIINPSQIEYCRGEVDKEKNQYGVRIHFVSGNTLWLPGETGEKFLATMESNQTVWKHESTKRSLVDKYNEKKSAQ